MKKTIVRLLVAVLLIGSLVGMLAACGGTKEVTVTVMDGDTAIKTITLEKGAKLDIKPSDVVKEGGYECTGLFTDAEMTATLGKDVTVEEDMTLYAAFRLKTLYLFAQGDPDEDEERISVTAGGSYTLPTPTREGYRFLGYFYGTEAFPQTGTYSYTDSITVKAKWQKIVYLNVFDGTTTTKVEVAADGSYELPNVANTDTHTFGGYKNGTAAFGAYDAESGKWVGTYTETADLTLTYNWVTIPTYTMTVNGLDGQSANYKTGDTYTLPAAPERSGYRFLGYKMNGQPFAATGTFTWSEGITVTAEWSPIVYINVYDGSSFVKKVEVAADGSFALDNVADVAGEKTFEGYVMGTTAFGTYDEETGKWTGTYTGTEDATVMYKWEGIVYAYITFNGIDLDPILIEEGKTSYQLYTIKPERPGFRFEGFTKGTEAVTGDTYTLTGDEATTGVVLTAVWSEIYYITIYDGSTAKPQKIEVAADGTVTLPKQDNVTGKLFAGYTMGGVTFTKNEDDGTYSASGITGHKDAYISWYVLPIVSFDTKGGAFEEAVDTVILTIGQNTLPIPTMEGFEFEGWQLGGQAFTGANGLYTLTEGTHPSGTTLHLVARWKQSSDGSNEVAGYNYFKESDGNGGYIYVFLTGTDNTYSFSGYTLSFQNNNDVVTQKSDNSFVADKPGSFQMTMTPTDGGAPVTVFCRVENRINGFTSGKNTDASYKANFQNGISDVIDAGMQNLVPHVLVNGNNNNVSTTLSFSDIPFDIKVEYKDKEDKDDEYQLYTAENGYTVKNGAITFTNELLHGKTVRVTLSPKYALSAEKAGQTVTFEYLLNDGVNVYTDAELYENFKNTAIKTINVQRDITAKLHATECACKDLETKCSGDHQYPINAWGVGAYVRTLGTDADSITLNGNHYKLDGSILPEIDPRNPGGQYSEDNGGYGGSGDATQDVNGLAYKTVNVQAGIISYFSPNGDTATGAQTLSVNDLYMTGGNTESPDLSVGVNGSTTDKDRILVGSMNFHGITTRLANLTATNVTLQNMHISLFNTGSTELAPTRLTTTVTLDGVRIDNSFSNHLYNWGQVGLTIKNSELKQASGAAIHYDDHPLSTTDASLASYLSIDSATTITNLVTGAEPWFNAYGMVVAAGGIKTEIPLLIGIANGNYDGIELPNGLQIPEGTGSHLPDIKPGKATVTDENSTEFFNLVCVIKEGGGKIDEWAQDKEYVITDAETQQLRGSAYVRILPADPEDEFKITDASAFGLVPYECFDSKLYVNKSLPGFGSAGIIVGLFQ